MKEHELKEPVIYTYPWEMVMAAYEKRFPICPEIPILLETKQTENITSPDGAQTEVLRWCKINAEAPGWLKRMAGVQFLVFFQRNCIDRAKRVLVIEAWNETFAGKVNIKEVCRYEVCKENPQHTAFYQSASLDLNLLPGFDGAAEWCFVNAYLANVKKGREIVEKFLRQLVDEEGIEEIPPFIEQPHTLGDGRDFVSTAEKIGINLATVPETKTSAPTTPTAAALEQDRARKADKKTTSFATSVPELPEVVVSGDDDLSVSGVRAGVLEGYLSKWTNYLSGYQKRYFILGDGVLQYYKSKEDADLVRTGAKLKASKSSSNTGEGGADPRGSIPIQDVVISVNSDSEVEFSVYNKDIQFYLQASELEERRRWIIALGSAKAQLIDEAGPVGGRARGMMSSPVVRGASSMQIGGNRGHSRNSSTCSLSAMDMNTPVTMDEKIAEIKTYEDLVTKQLKRLKEDMNEVLLGKPGAVGEVSEDVEATVREIKEREMVFTATSKALLDVLVGSIDAIRGQERDWERVLEKESNKRLELERSINHLNAKKNELERALSANKEKLKTSSKSN
eukprot:Nk52_evm148s226 gene=Nk52_evmTU148s226